MDTLEPPSATPVPTRRALSRQGLLRLSLFFVPGVALMWAVDQRSPRAEARWGDTVQPPGTWDDSDSPFPVTSLDPMWGQRDALVTIVEYGDLSAALGAQLDAELAEVRSAYSGDKVRIVWKNYVAAGDDRARSVAEAAQGVFVLAGADAFWDFQRAASMHLDSPANDWLVASARDAGVKDVEAYEAGLNRHVWAGKVKEDTEGGDALNVKWAPTLIVNGTVIQGLEPALLLRGLVERELERAQAKIAAGTPRTRVYVEITKEKKRIAVDRASLPDDGQDTTTVYSIPIGQGAALGPPSAPVTIVEFSEFQCPFSARFEKKLGALRAKYGDRIRVVWKNVPFPPHLAAEAAAEAAAEVRAEQGDRAFWQIHDTLFANRKDLVVNGSTPNVDLMVKLANEAGADAAGVRRAIREHTRKRELDADAALAHDYDVADTPTFFINGRRLVGAQPQAWFERVIEEEITRAEGLVAKGIAPADVYDALTKGGRAPSR